MVEYDAMNVSDVIANLTARGIYQTFVDWYNLYFGSNGTVVAYYLSQAAALPAEDNSSLPL